METVIYPNNKFRQTVPLFPLPLFLSLNIKGKIFFQLFDYRYSSKQNENLLLKYSIRKKVLCLWRSGKITNAKQNSTLVCHPIRKSLLLGKMSTNQKTKKRMLFHHSHDITPPYHHHHHHHPYNQYYYYRQSDE